MSLTAEAIARYVRKHVFMKSSPDQTALFPQTAARFEKAFSLLPEETLELFLSDSRSLTVEIMPDPGLPLGMKTQTTGPASQRRYIIVVYHEHLTWPEDLFVAAFLREIGHVAAKRPPEAEWPTERGARARFKERLENRADAMVWRWGLRHYSMRHIAATYPEHRVEQIVQEIGKVFLEENGEY
jgi:hypothetical protein